VKTDSTRDAEHEPPGGSARGPAADPVTPGRTLIGVTVIIGTIASAVGTYGGANVLVPLLAGFLMAWLIKKLSKPRDALLAMAFAVFFGHFAWGLAGTLILGSWDTATDLVIMIILMLWLWFRPGRWSCGAMAIFSMFGLTHAVIDLQAHSFGDPTHRALVTHMVLRLAVIALVCAWWRTQLEGQAPRPTREGSAP
jgi:hypothetical protein